MERAILKWIWTRDLHRKDEPGRVRTEYFASQKWADSRWEGIKRRNGGAVTRLA